MFGMAGRGPKKDTSLDKTGSAAASPAALEKAVANIINPKTRDAALGELSKNRDKFADLAPMLWHSTATFAALL